jgi:hypothetical protein
MAGTEGVWWSPSIARAVHNTPRISANSEPRQAIAAPTCTTAVRLQSVQVSGLTAPSGAVVGATWQRRS